jgi:AcrR family transcriptional regulator
VQQLTITELEKASRVPRSTIYFYVREGLLPMARKLAPTRAIYSEVHLGLLAEITRLRAEGLSLEEIKSRVSSRVSAGNATADDLSAERAAQVRRSILIAAARLFVARGYHATRVDDIVVEVGISTPVFYRYFPSKQEVFAEVFGAFVHWMRTVAEAARAQERDPIARELAQVSSFYFGMKSVSRDAIALIRSEAMREDSEMTDMAKATIKEMNSTTTEDLARRRLDNGVSIPVADELVSFAVSGAIESIIMRASWDTDYSLEDVLRAAAAVLLGVTTMYSRGTDAARQMSTYVDIIERLAKTPTWLPTDELLLDALEQ